MKNKILEVQNFFINKITACEFTVKEITFSNGWARLQIDVDDYDFSLSIYLISEIIVVHESGSFMNLEIPNDRLSNILQLIKNKEQEAKNQQIERLKAELVKLQTA